MTVASLRIGNCCHKVGKSGLSSEPLQEFLTMLSLKATTAVLTVGLIYSATAQAMCLPMQSTDGCNRSARVLENFWPGSRRPLFTTAAHSCDQSRKPVNNRNARFSSLCYLWVIHVRMSHTGQMPAVKKRVPPTELGGPLRGCKVGLDALAGRKADLSLRYFG